MSVYIKGMEMPNTWRDCMFSNGAAQCKLKNWSYCGTTFDCPLVPVPPHGRLIDADAIPERFLEVRDLAPTIIEAEEGE